jgi:hypothetical protein
MPEDTPGYLGTLKLEFFDPAVVMPGQDEFGMGLECLLLKEGFFEIGHAEASGEWWCSEGQLDTPDAWALLEGKVVTLADPRAMGGP